MRTTFWREAHLVRKLLCVLLIAAMLMASSISAYATKEKAVVTHDVAIVFDNSGSMYYGGKTLWCQATYAIEVFAAMMNDGDTLTVFPMNPITVDNTTYTSESPLVISKPSEASKIQRIFSPADEVDTPIEPIALARDYLADSSADEAWLIVTTDGTEFYENGVGLGDATNARLQEEMGACAEAGINVTYLGIGVSKTPVVNHGNYHAYAANNENILSQLTAICNAIFGRDSLPEENRQNSTLSFDIPMSKLLIFAQGANISELSLDGAGEAATTYAPHYSTLGAGGKYTDNCGVDESLQGVIATYENLDAGEYTLTCSGSVTSVAVYYEPDVDLTVQLSSDVGYELGSDDSCYPGDYTIEFTLVDKYGNPVESSLLGETAYSIRYAYNGQEQTIEKNTAGSTAITLSAGDTLESYGASVDFLSGYHIEKSSDQLGWPVEGFQIEPRPAGSLELSISGGQDEYGLSELEESGVYDLQLFYDGQPATAEKLQEIQWTVSFESKEDSAPEAEIVVDGSQAALHLKYRNGDPQQTACEDYDMSVFAQYENEDGQVATSNTCTAYFEIEEESNTLKLSLDVNQKNVLMSKLDEAEPIIANLTYNRQPLTDDMLDAVEITADSDVKFTAEPLYGESAVEIRVDPNQTVAKGRYPVTVTASVYDDVGNQLTDTEKTNLEFIRYPIWLRWLVLLAALLLLALIVVIYMSMKVLPNGMEISDDAVTFRVNGSQVAGDGDIDYRGKRKNKGSLAVSTPDYIQDPMVVGGFELGLVARSTRWKKSSRRQVGITEVLDSGVSVRAIQFGTLSYQRNNNGDFSRVGAVDEGSILDEFGDSTYFEISGETYGGTSFKYSGYIQFN